MLSYNELIKINKQFADNHYVIKNFGNGERWQIIDHQQTASFKYPLMFMEDLASNTGEKRFSYAFRVWFVTRVEAPKERGTELLYAEFAKGKSDMIACAKDLIAFWVQDTNYPELELDRSVNIETFIDSDPDNFTGCYADIRFNVVMNYDNCIIPMDGVPLPESNDVVITINGSTWETYLAGTTNNIVVKDTDGTEVGSKVGSEWIVPAAGGGDPVANTMNGVSLTDAAAGTTKNFTIRYEDDSPVTVTTVSDSATAFIGEVPNVPTYNNVSSLTYKTGQEVNYTLTDDDGTTQRGRGSSWDDLGYNNFFGNTDRFTDTSGGQIYADNIVLDWAYWDEENKLVRAWYKIPLTSGTLETYKASEPYTFSGVSSWVNANWSELQGIVRQGIEFLDPLNYAPFNLGIATYGGFWSVTISGVLNRYQIQVGGGYNRQVITTGGFSSILTSIISTDDL